MHNQEKRKLADGRDRREIRDDIIGRILAQDRNPQHGGTSAKQDGVAVRCGFRHHLAPNCGLGAGSVFHHYRLAESLGERLRDDAGHGVRGPSGGKRHDDANGLRGILRSRWNADEAQNCYGGEDAHQLLHDFSSLQIASLPEYVKPRWSNTGLPDTCWVKASLLARDFSTLTQARVQPSEPRYAIRRAVASGKRPAHRASSRRVQMLAFRIVRVSPGASG